MCAGTTEVQLACGCGQVHGVSAELCFAAWHAAVAHGILCLVLTSMAPCCCCPAGSSQEGARHPVAHKQAHV